MPKKKIDFEEYLQEQHALRGFRDSIFGDFNVWLDGLDIEEWIEYGDKFGQELLKGKGGKI